MINYKKAMIVSMLFLVILLIPENAQMQHEGAVDALGQPSESLMTLLHITGIEHDGSLRSIVEQTQSNWLRRAGTERWDIVDKRRENEDQIMHWLAQLQMIDEIKPASQTYDYMLWMGGAFPRVLDRLQYFIAQWQQGVRSNQIVMLAGARPLTCEESTAIQNFYSLDESSLPATESELMRMIYEKIDMPETMKVIPCVFIDVPMQETLTSGLRRPTTGDTIDFWMALHPTPGKCLVVSTQPFVIYQDSVTKTLLPSCFIVESCGEKSVETKIDLYLDSLARVLYQEKKRLSL